VLAPNAKLRHQVTTLRREQGAAQESPSEQLDTPPVAASSGGAPGRRTSSRWASLIARIYDVLPLVCPWAPREAWSGIFEFDQTGGFDPTDPEPIPDHASRGALEFDQSMPD